MKIHPAKQGSMEWMLARAGIPTASEFGSLVTPEFKIRTGETPASYLAEKVAEAWTRAPLPGFSSFSTDQGKFLEDEAIPAFMLETGLEVERVGLCTTDDGRIGCSPDGLIGSDEGLEIKAPAMETHVKYLLRGVVPKEYLPQIHGGMLVTGRASWRFVSYRRGFPMLMVTVNRDEEIQEILQKALDSFLELFALSMSHLEELNGGPSRAMKLAAKAAAEGKPPLSDLDEHFPL